MTTISKSYHSSHATTTKSNGLAERYNAFIEKMHFSYFGLISMTILIGSILGGITAMCILENNAPIWQLGACLAISMANNVAAIGQATTKWIVNLFALTLLINIVLILINVI
ncbi:MAG: hypothetical protein JST26_19490 [Bacteroidetes bacterium]|nr:hypothetical protein [Bacteroidota bacterium]